LDSFRGAGINASALRSVTVGRPIINSSDVSNSSGGGPASSDTT
jgi:hypothetical protein